MSLLRRFRRASLPRAGAFTVTALLAVTLLGGCADTLQNQPLHDRDLEGAAKSTQFPIYWVGRAFEGYSVSNLSQDGNGAVSIAYGDCTVGGQSVCVTPLLIVTSPDNSFVPGAGPHHPGVIRGRRASVSQDGRAIALPTAAVVVSVFGQTPDITAAAARSLATINVLGGSAGALPVPVADTGYARTPLGGPTQPYVTPFAAGVSGDAVVPAQ